MSHIRPWDDHFEKTLASTASAILVVLWLITCMVAAGMSDSFWESLSDKVSYSISFRGPITIVTFIIGVFIGAVLTLIFARLLTPLLRRLYRRNPFWLPKLLKVDRYGYHWYPEIAEWLRARGYAFDQAPFILEETEGPTYWRTAHVSDTKILARKLWEDMLSRDM